MKQKQLQNKTRHDFLHTFFPVKDSYQIVEVNGYFLVNQFNAGNSQWEVAIFAPDAFKKRQEWLEGKKAQSKEQAVTQLNTFE